MKHSIGLGVTAEQWKFLQNTPLVKQILPQALEEEPGYSQPLELFDPEEVWQMSCKDVKQLVASSNARLRVPVVMSERFPNSILTVNRFRNACFGGHNWPWRFEDEVVVTGDRPRTQQAGPALWIIGGTLLATGIFGLVKISKKGTRRRRR